MAAIGFGHARNPELAAWDVFSTALAPHNQSSVKLWFQWMSLIHRSSVAQFVCHPVCAVSKLSCVRPYCCLLDGLVSDIFVPVTDPTPRMRERKSEH